MFRVHPYACAAMIDTPEQKRLRRRSANLRAEREAALVELRSVRNGSASLENAGCFALVVTVYTHKPSLCKHPHHNGFSARVRFLSTRCRSWMYVAHRSLFFFVGAFCFSSWVGVSASAMRRAAKGQFYFSTLGADTGLARTLLGPSIHAFIFSSAYLGHPVWFTLAIASSCNALFCLLVFVSHCFDYLTICCCCCLVLFPIDPGGSWT